MLRLLSHLEKRLMGLGIPYIMNRVGFWQTALTNRILAKAGTSH